MWISDQETTALLECALWQAGEEFDGFTTRDLSRLARAVLRRDYGLFRESYARTLEGWQEHLGHSGEQIAHDFILTRNRHGAGFWDRCYCGRCGHLSHELTVGAHVAGEFYLYIGDFGKVEIL